MGEDIGGKRMYKKIISGILVALLVIGTVVSPLNYVGNSFVDSTITILAENKSAVKLDKDVMYYEGLYRQSRQIPCEALGGIYFLNGTELIFYSIDTANSSLVYTFEKTDNTFVAGDKLYVLDGTRYGSSGRYSIITTYNLISQKIEKTMEFNQPAYAIGADALGRIYLSGPSGEAYAIYLLSADGELLSQTSSKQQIYDFSGFDSKNGNFYVDSYDNWVYWGYDHDMHALRAGNVSGSAISFNDELCMQLVSQSYYYNREEQIELLGDKYICIDSTFQNGLHIWDSNAYSVTEGNDTSLISLKRDNKESGKFDTLACVGVRAVYKEASDSLIAFKDNSSIAEYDISTGEEIISVSTAYPVFSLMKYKDGVVAIEKAGTDFYLEYFPWINATIAKISGDSSDMKVGETLILTVSTDGTLEEKFTWSSSNPKVASVNQSGEVFAWRKGTTTITVKSKTGLSAEYVLTVSADSSVQTPKNHAVTTSGEKTENASANNYTVWSSPMNSYLVENTDSTLTRIEYNDKKIIVETYSLDGSVLQSSKTLECELELFGGFHSGSDYNYFVFGNKNTSESDACEVIRIVKYSKDWNRIGSISVNGANTYIPFDAGSLRMTETNGKLYIYTCHEMYDEGDGNHHQANMTFVVNENDFTIEQSYYDVMNIAQAGYVSHSFNQFIQTDGKYIYRVDHGDFSPRAVSITRCKVDGSITDVNYTLPVDLSKVSGYNQTGASIGGFELSSESCIIAGNAVDFTASKADCNEIRNIFVSITDKKMGNADIVWLTDYRSDEKVEVYTPHFVKIGNDSFLVMWEEFYEEENKKYTELLTIDGLGNITSDRVTTDMRLSDCEPILCKDGLVRWYAATGGSPIVYVVNPFDLEAAHTHIYDKGTLKKEATCTETGIKTYHCKKCSEIKEEEVPIKGHSYDNGTITKQPTVTLEGEKTYTCKNCGATKTENIEKKSPESIEKAVINGLSTKVYTGKEVTLNIIVKVNENVLKENIDYKISYENNINAGKAAIIIEGIGNYSGSITRYFNIKPNVVTILSVKPVKKTQMKVTWKKNSQADGYQIVYATDKKFTKRKHSLTVHGLKSAKNISKLSKGKKYYVKIRAYKIIDNKKVYGSYSKVKVVTIKKK